MKRKRESGLNGDKDAADDDDFDRVQFSTNNSKKLLMHILYIPISLTTHTLSILIY